MFNPSICCKNDAITIRLLVPFALTERDARYVDDEIADYSLTQSTGNQYPEELPIDRLHQSIFDQTDRFLPYLPFVKRIYAVYQTIKQPTKSYADRCQTFLEAIKQTIKQSIANRAIQSITIDEWIQGSSTTVTGALLDALHELNESIEEANYQSASQSMSQSLTESHSPSLDQPIYQNSITHLKLVVRRDEDCVIDWACLTYLDVLTSFSLRLNRNSKRSINEMREILISLPESLLDCSIEMYGFRPNDEELWAQHLSCTDRLVNLQSLDTKHDYFDIGEALSSTLVSRQSISQANNQSYKPRTDQPIGVRPMRSIQMVLKNPVHLSPFKHLESINLQMNQQLIDDFVSLGEQHFKHLTSFTFELTSLNQPANQAINQFDMSPLLCMLCKPGIREMNLTLFCAGSVAPVHDQAVQAMSSMTALTKLCISFDQNCALFDQSVNMSINQLIPEGCWPHLVIMRLTGTICTTDQIDRLLSAGPALREVCMRNTHGPSSSSDLVFNFLSVSRRCPLLTLFAWDSTVSRVRDTEPVTLLQLQQALHDEPLSQAAFQHLWRIEINHPFSHLAIHLFLSQLREIPRLTYVKMDCLETTKLATCMQRCLPHLRGIMSCFWKAEDVLYATHDQQTDDCFSYRYLTAIRTLGEPEACAVDDPEYWNEARLVFRTFGWNLNYPIFSRDVDTNGRNGREAFFSALYDELDDEEKRSLTHWDGGSYYK